MRSFFALVDARRMRASAQAGFRNRADSISLKEKSGFYPPSGAF